MVDRRLVFTAAAGSAVAAAVCLVLLLQIRIGDLPPADFTKASQATVWSDALTVVLGSHAPRRKQQPPTLQRNDNIEIAIVSLNHLAADGGAATSAPAAATAAAKEALQKHPKVVIATAAAAAAAAAVAPASATASAKNALQKHPKVVVTAAAAATSAAAAAEAPAAAPPAAGEAPSVGPYSSSPRLLMFGEHENETGDWCKGLNHTRRSLACQVFCAFALNRTLVLGRHLCLSADHVGRETLRPLALYFDLDAFAGLGVAYVYRDQLPNASDPSSMQPTTQSVTSPPTGQADSAAGVATETATTALGGNGGSNVGAGAAVANAAAWTKSTASRFMVLEDYVNTSADVLLVGVRKRFNKFTLCEEVPKNKALIQLSGRNRWEDWVPLNPHVVRIALHIVATLRPMNFTAVHVRRGDKAMHKRIWPHLDRDTRPEALMKKLPNFVEPGSHLYIASTEPSQFFKPLWKKYKLHFLTDYSHLWARGSEWHASCKRVSGFEGEPVFDSYMQAIVDYTVMESATRRVETFNDLTDDPKCGVILCGNKNKTVQP